MAHRARRSRTFFSQPKGLSVWSWAAVAGCKRGAASGSGASSPIVVAGLTLAIGSIGPALGEARAVAQAISAIAQQPDEANTITRTLFVGLAMIESTAIYCFVVSMILIFANPFWNHAIAQMAGK